MHLSPSCFLALALGGSKAMLVTTEIPIPLSLDSPPQSVISQTHILCKGAVLCMDFHPIKRSKKTLILNLCL